MPLVCLWALVVLSTLLPIDATLLKAAVRSTCGLVACSVVAYYWTRPRCRHVTQLCLPFTLFVGLALLSVLWSPLKQISLWQAGSLAILFALAVSIGVLAGSLSDLSRVLLNLSALLLANSIMLLGARFLVPSLESLTRVGEGAFHSSSASASASLGIILLVVSLTFWGWRWSWYLVLPGLLTHCLVLFLAVNRVAILMALVIPFLALVMASARNRALATGCLVIACLSGTLYLGLDPGLRQAERLLNAASSYASREQTVDQLMELSGRLEMWGTVWEEYLRSPLLGHGYFVSSPEGEIFVWYEWGNWTAHNVVLQCLMSLGLMGFVLLAWGAARLFCSWKRSHSRGLLPAHLTGFLALICIWNICWGTFSASVLGPLVPESVCMFALLGAVLGQLVPSEAPARTTLSLQVIQTGPPDALESSRLRQGLQL